MIETSLREHLIWSVLDAADIASARENPNEFSISLSKLYQYFRWVLESSDPTYITQQELDSLTNEVRSSTSVIPAGEITNQVYNQALQQLTPSLSKFPYPRIKKIFRSEVNDIVGQIEAEAAVLQDTLSRLQGELHDTIAKSQEAETTAASVVAELASSKAQIAAMSGVLEEKNSSNISTAIAEMRTDYTNEKNARSERFQEEVNTRKDQLAGMMTATDTLAKRTDAELKLVREEQSEKLKEFESLARSKYNEIDKLFQDAGQTVLAGGFAKAAVGEKTRYESDARYAKWSFGLAAIVLGVLVGFDLLQGSFTWLDAIYKLPISVVLAAPGLYFAGLAAKHRQEANRLRSLGLRIGAFDSFVKASDPENAVALRNIIAPHFFSEDGRKPADETGDLISDKFLDAFGKIADKLPKIGK